MAGINCDCEVWAAAHVIGGINAVVNTLVEMNAGGRYEMTACRKADDADSARVDVPFGSMLPRQADGSLGIVQSLGSLWIGTRLRIFR